MTDRDGIVTDSTTAGSTTAGSTTANAGPGQAGTMPVRPGSGLSVARCLELYRAQLGSRHLDLAAAWLRERNLGFYTIGSSGHEGNAGVAAALRVTDPALLHYRSGAFYLARAGQAGAGERGGGQATDGLERGLRDVLLGLVAAAEEPIAGGRHKVFGRADLSVIPQTSTIASHLPRAVGLAFAIDRARRLGPGFDRDEEETWRGWPVPRWPQDAVVVCSF